MMCVKWITKQSPIHGLGVFADEFITTGTVIWKFNGIIDKEISQQELESLPQHIQKYIRHYTYRDGESFVLAGDDARYFNHSDNPNTEGVESEDGFGMTLAARDIEPGEELTANYAETDDDYAYKKTENLFV